MDDFDVVVSGGGVVGLCAAWVFAKAGRKVLVVESSSSESQNINHGRLNFDLRSLALSPAVIAWLKKFGIDAHTIGQSISRMRVWESIGTASIEFSPEMYGLNDLAVVVEHQRLQTALSDVISGQVEMLFDSEIEAIDAREHTVSIGGQLHRSLRPELLVIAEGARSKSVKFLGVKGARRNLRQHAIVTVVKTSHSHKGVALQRFSPSPIAFLPLSVDRFYSVIWSLPDARFTELSGLDDDVFKARLQCESEGLAGSILEIDRRASFPLAEHLVEDFNPLSWVLIIGDSAHSIHPLAGQGINIGIEDVASMERFIERKGSQDLDKAGRWRSFNIRRRRRAQMMIKAMSFFDLMWKFDNPYFRLIRNTGVRWVDSNQSLKRLLIAEACGIGPSASFY